MCKLVVPLAMTISVDSHPHSLISHDVPGSRRMRKTGTWPMEAHLLKTTWSSSRRSSGRGDTIPMLGSAIASS